MKLSRTPLLRALMMLALSLIYWAAPGGAAASAHPLVTPEFLLDAASAGPSPCTRAAPAVAANESGYLVVWTHGNGSGDITRASVYAARVDPNGVLLDPEGILVSTIAGEQTACAVAANPGMFLVAWTGPHGTSATDWDILGVRITSAGVILDSAPLPICTLSSIQNSPAVAANGENFLVTWRDSLLTSINGTIVATNGSLSTTNGIPLLNGSFDQYTPAVAALGTDYLVVAQDYRRITFSLYDSDIYAARVSRTGVVIDSAGFAVCTNSGSQFQPSVAADSTNYLVVWQDYDLGGGNIRGARVSGEGVVLDTNAFTISSAPNLQANPAVASDGGDFLVSWQDFRDSSGGQFAARTYAARVSGEGAVIDSDGVMISPVSGGQSVPAVAARQGEWLAVWQDSRNNSESTLSDVFGARVSVSNTLAAAPDMRISGAVNAEVGPAVAAIGSTYLAVWADNRHDASNSWDICGIRFDADGSILDAEPLWICTATNRQLAPAVATGLDAFFVAWSDWRNADPTVRQGDIYGTTIGVDGSVHHPGGIAICAVTNDQTLPAAAAFGTNFLVVWQDSRASLPLLERWDIYGARVTGAGQVLDPAGIAICTNIQTQTSPAVAATTSRALVVWADHRLNALYPGIYGARVNPDGAVADANGFAICALNSTTHTFPAVASDGSQFFAVWSDSRNGAANAPDIYGAWISESGELAPTNGFAIRSGAGPQSLPDLAFNGLDFLVTWQEAAASINFFDLYAVQIDPGSPFTAGPVLPVVTNAANRLYPAVAAGSDDRFVVLNQGTWITASHVMASYVNSEAVPRLDEINAALDGQIQFRFRGAVGERYEIDVSEDLRSWSPLWTFTNSSPASTFFDTNTTIPHRLYRSLLLP